MSEPFYYGPWDIEKIQNDIEELKEGGGSGGDLPYFFPDYLKSFKIEQFVDGEYEELIIPNSAIFERYLSGDMMFDFSSDVDNSSSTDATKFKITFTINKYPAYYYNVTESTFDEMTSPFEITMEEVIATEGLVIFALCSDTPTIETMDSVASIIYEIKFNYSDDNPSNN